MRNLVSVIALKIMFVSSVWAQTFIPLATDTQADNYEGFPDLRSMAVAIQKDSIKARIEFFDELASDYGFIIGFNTDGNSNNGKYLQQDSLDFKYDTRLVVSRNAIFQPQPEGFIQDANDEFKGGVLVTIISPKVVEIAVAKQDIDFQQNADVVVASAGFDIAQAPINDFMPNQGSARLQTTHISETMKQKIRFQQPVQQVLRILTTPEHHGEFFSIQITDILGNKVMQGEMQLGASYDVSFLSRGTYILTLIHNNTINSTLLFKQ